MANYQLLHADRLPSAEAIRARLRHVLDYIETLPSVKIACEAVDEAWVSRFRAWAVRQPIVSPKGLERPRSLGTIENSVIQLAAAIRFAQARGDTLHGPRFKAHPIKQINQTPEHRSDVAELAAMFRYCVSPPKARSAKETERRVRERAALRRFLLISIATLARPDAALDFSTKKERRQWNSRARVLKLNPKGRMQTKKFRATVKVAWQVAAHIDAAPPGYFVGPKSVRSAWEAMATELGLPAEGEAGLKLIRRSMAMLLRQRGVPVEQVEMMLGHRRIDSTSEIYAPFETAFLTDAVTAIEAILDEIEGFAPGALRGECAANDAVVVPLKWLKNG